MVWFITSHVKNNERNKIFFSSQCKTTTHEHCYMKCDGKNVVTCYHNVE